VIISADWLDGQPFGVGPFGRLDICKHEDVIDISISAWKVVEFKTLGYLYHIFSTQIIRAGMQMQFSV
jgi:hypothetical protein